MWKKILGILAAILAFIVSIFLNSRGKDNRAKLAANKRSIGESLNRTGQAIDRQGQAIDRAIGIVGSDKDREYESAKRESDDAQLIADSRAARARAKELLDRH